MRTTLSIDDDVLAAAKAIAQQQRTSTGKVVSDLARRTLDHAPSLASRNGAPLLASGNGRAAVTLSTTNALRDELP